jgi:hypothetical protein
MLAPVFITEAPDGNFVLADAGDACRSHCTPSDKK